MTRMFLIACLLVLAPSKALHAQIAEPIPGRYLVAYGNGAIPGDAEQRTLLTGAHVLQRHERLGLTSVAAERRTLSAEEDRAILLRLAGLPGVSLVVHDRYVRAHSIVLAPQPLPRPIQPVPPGRHPVVPFVLPGDTLYSSPAGWAVRRAGGFGAGFAGGVVHGPWNTTLGRGVRIAVLDSGVDATHPDIAPNLALNLSEVDHAVLPSPCDDGSPQDQEGHGTWTASLAAGALGPGTGEMAGVAPQASILNIKVLQRMPSATGDCTAGQAGGLLSWVLQGIEAAVANHADIVSLSLGSLIDVSTGEGAGLKAIFDQATWAATQAGTLVIAALGNDGLDLSQSSPLIELPAQARGVLSIVAATNPACAESLSAGAACVAGKVTRPYYSNYGAPAALAVPGGSYPEGPSAGVSGWVTGACSSGIPGTVNGSAADAAHSLGCFGLGHVAYVQAMGTSAAAALAAGAAALIRAAHPTMSPGQVAALLRNSATVSAGMPTPQIDAANLLP